MLLPLVALEASLGGTVNLQVVLDRVRRCSHSLSPGARDIANATNDSVRVSWKKGPSGARVPPQVDCSGGQTNVFGAQATPIQ